MSLQVYLLVKGLGWNMRLLSYLQIFKSLKSSVERCE